MCTLCVHFICITCTFASALHFRMYFHSHSSSHFYLEVRDTLLAAPLRIRYTYDTHTIHFPSHSYSRFYSHFYSHLFTRSFTTLFCRRPLCIRPRQHGPRGLTCHSRSTSASTSTSTSTPRVWLLSSPSGSSSVQVQVQVQVRERVRVRVRVHVT